MKIKTIFWIAITCIFVQLLPLLATFFSPEFKLMLVSNVLGDEPSSDTISMFDQFAFVLSFVGLGFISMIFGAFSFDDLESLRKVSFLFFIFSIFWTIPDLLNLILGEPAAPIPIIILGLIQVGLFYYGSKKGVV
tara:strand:- start:1514 stop:1918 length:405 start_codon:yes stop_codon:yes gene_type:complete